MGERWVNVGWTLGGRWVDAGWTLGGRWLDAQPTFNAGKNRSSDGNAMVTVTLPNHKKYCTYIIDLLFIILIQILIMFKR